MYKILPVKNAKAIKILCIGKVNDKINDQFIKSMNIYDDIYIDLYSAVISHIKIMASKSQPILYGDIAYIRGLKRYFILRIYLMFNIEENVTSEEQFMNDELSGSYTIKLIIGNVEKEIKSNNLIFVSDDSEMFEYICNVLKNPLIKELINELLKQIEGNKEKEFDKYKIRQHNIDKLI